MYIYRERERLCVYIYIRKYAWSSRGTRPVLLVTVKAVNKISPRRIIPLALAKNNNANTSFVARLEHGTAPGSDILEWQTSHLTRLFQESNGMSYHSLS